MMPCGCSVNLFWALVLTLQNQTLVAKGGLNGLLFIRNQLEESVVFMGN
jgi:hypothetical protein